MELKSQEQLQPFVDLIDAYNQSFYDKDVDAFRSLHIRDNNLVFFDNHAGCDSFSYQNHEDNVRTFFESGKISQLTKENIRVFQAGDMACVTMVLRYAKSPKPGVRSTFVVERVEKSWLIRHMHHSFDPNEVDEPFE